MAYQIIFSEEAKIQLQSIFNYLLNNWSDKVATDFIIKVDEILFLISLNPKLYPQTKKRKGIRKCVVTKQTSLYYHLLKNEIEIITFFDNRQNPNKINF